MTGVLDGIKVLDLTNVLAGPFCAYQLTQLGADVLKVETPGTGDLARVLGADPALSGQLMGASFLAQNGGKRSMTLNLKSDEGKALFKALVEGADVVVENFRPGVMDRLGLGYETLKAVNPKLVYCAISGFGQDGPMRAAPAYDIGLGITAFGPNTLELAGRAFDQVVLHTYFTDETLQRAVRTVKSSAERAGRDPDAVQVWSCYATVHDGLPEPTRLKKTVGRLATYLQAYGDLLVRTNGWDPEVLRRFREDPLVASFHGALDDTGTTADLEHVAGLIPDEWLAPSATGSPERCAELVRRQLDLGADGVIMHGASPTELAPVVAAYAASRSR